jgi:hypothetical protein
VCVYLQVIDQHITCLCHLVTRNTDKDKKLVGQHTHTRLTRFDSLSIRMHTHAQFIAANLWLHGTYSNDHLLSVCNQTSQNVAVGVKFHSNGKP